MLGAMSKEPCAATAQVASAVKASPQFARLRIAEADETSISGEELYTDGSSDEDSCKNSPARDAAKNSALARLARSRGRPINDPRLRGRSFPGSQEGDGRTASAAGLGAGDGEEDEDEDEDDEDDDDDEISWKANREEEIMIENEMIAIEQCRKEYPAICDSADSTFEQYFRELINLEQEDSEIFLEGQKKIKGDLMNSIQFLDTTMNKIMSRVEQIKKKTQQIQLQNRLKLKEILKNNPRQSAKLADNTKKFFELYTGKGLSDPSDSCRTETAKDTIKPCAAESKF